jgi:UDP-N-acetylmuramoylalanine--D-glutamate ligase
MYGEKSITGKNIVILGAARSGLSAATLLKKAGNDVFVSDIATRNKLKEKNYLTRMNIPFEFGKHSDRIYQADFIVLSPGIPSTSAVIQAVKAHNIPVYSEIEVAGWFCRSSLIAITGSNGKTTTTTVLGKMLKHRYQDAFVAGNIGEPFSDFVFESSPDVWAAVEVSSFQLETIDQFHPSVVIILNLAPNHLDWYHSFEEYASAKLRILNNLTPDDYIITDGDDPDLCHRIYSHDSRKYKFTVSGRRAEGCLLNNALYLFNEKIIATDQIALFGRHNYKNLMAAGIAAKIAGVSSADIREVMRTFKGVTHRLETVAEIKGVKFINDSKATTLESLEAALQSFQQPVILIAGGKDKGADFKRLQELVKEKVKRAVLIGAASERIMQSWKDSIPVVMAHDLEEAADGALDAAQAGDVVLLSPACSSFDMFRDFEDRGNTFKKIVNQMKRKYENK